METRTRHGLAVPAPCAAAAVLLGAMLAAAVARAEEPQVGTLKLMDPRAIGLAGALRAAPGSCSGMYLNPATIAMTRAYHIGLAYQFTGQDDLHTAGAAVVDSVTSPVVAAGLSLNYLRADERRTDHESWDARIAVAANIADVFFLGITGRYLRVEHDLESGNRGPNGAHALPSSGSQQLDGLTFDAGAVVSLGGVVNIGVAGYNLSKPDSIYAPLQLAPGIAVTLFDVLIVEGDLVVDFTSHREINQEVNAGVELLVAQVVPLRLGYRYDVLLDIHGIAAGVGYLSKVFAADVGFQHDLREDGRLILALGLRFFLQ
jgi:opacity protein-like surface antigen